MKILIIDNLSPFTPQITQTIDKIGIGSWTCKRYSEIKSSDIRQTDRIILSGRRSNSNETNKINSLVIRQSLSLRKHLLGICYGAEIIALTFGGTIARMPQPLSGFIEITVTKNSPITNLDKVHLRVYESHKFRIARLPLGFASLASSIGTPHEIFCDSSGLLWGTQFHPEKSGPDGFDVLNNFLNLTGSAG